MMAATLRSCAEKNRVYTIEALNEDDRNERGLVMMRNRLSILVVLGLVAAGWLLAPAAGVYAAEVAKQAGKPGDAVQPTLTPEQVEAQKYLDRFKTEMDVQQKMQAHQAEQHVRVGKDHFDMQAFKEALRHFVGCDLHVDLAGVVRRISASENAYRRGVHGLNGNIRELSPIQEIGLPRGHKLVGAVPRFGPACRITRIVHGRQQQGAKHADDGDHHQHLQQCETAPVHVATPIPK